MTGKPSADPAWRRRPAAAALVAISLAAAAGTTASAAPADTTTLQFEVVPAQSGGGLHLSVSSAGNATHSGGPLSTGTVLPRAVVYDDRGGGPRDWSATVSTLGFSESTEVSYRVESLQVPDTGSVFNRMHTWTSIRAAHEAVVAIGVSRPSVVTSWEPHLRVVASPGGAGSSGSGSGSVDSSGLVVGSLESSGSGGSAGSGGSTGSAGSHGPPRRGALVTSVM